MAERDQLLMILTCGITGHTLEQVKSLPISIIRLFDIVKTQSPPESKPQQVRRKSFKIKDKDVTPMDTYSEKFSPEFTRAVLTERCAPSVDIYSNLDTAIPKAFKI